ncbi:MAG: GntR family transcriptional regulator [Acidobacteria bacterium]|nr:GntR family transcriptional regulator [Acidobacteriota bacterium]
MSIRTSEVPVTAERASDAAYSLLLDRIVNLSIAPGALLNEQSLAAELDYGRTPVREALARLSADRFVTILPRRGIIVAPITFEEVLAMFEARETIECGIAYIAATRVTEDDLEEMRRLVTTADTARLTGDPEEFLLADHAVHTFLVHMIKNPILQEAAERLLAHNLRFWRLYWRDRPVSPEAMLSHAALITAVESQDSRTAEEAMRHHLRASCQLVQLLFVR